MNQITERQTDLNRLKQIRRYLEVQKSVLKNHRTVSSSPLERREINVALNTLQGVENYIERITEPGENYSRGLL